MRLSRGEVEQVRVYLQVGGPRLADTLLAKVEIGVWLFPPFLGIHVPLMPIPITASVPVLLAATFGSSGTQALFDGFKSRLFPYLLIRAESWEVFLNCNGEILTEHCEEDLDAIRDACERLRERCGRGTPSVKV